MGQLTHAVVALEVDIVDWIVSDDGREEPDCLASTRDKSETAYLTSASVICPPTKNSLPSLKIPSTLSKAPASALKAFSYAS